MNGFRQDLMKAKEAEKIVREVFTSLTDRYSFEDVSEDRDCFYKGDIKATPKTINCSREEIYIEVKDDSRIGETKNILCEEEVYFKECDYYSKGNMKAGYDIYCIVSKSERKIYVLDFKKLRNIYKKGEFKSIEHPAQITYCYLLPLGLAQEAIITIISY